MRIIKKNLPENSKVYFITYEKSKCPNKNAFLSEKKQFEKEGIHWIPYRYSKPGITAAMNILYSILSLLLLCFTKQINTIHCWCTPAGGIGYILSRLSGKKLILDSYEPHAEVMVETGTWKKNGMVHKLLFYLEKKQTKRAAVMIAAVSAMKEYASEKYGLNLKNFYVKPSCVDLELFNIEKFFNAKKELGLENKITCVYAGKFGGMYLEKEVFDFLKSAQDFWKEKFSILLLTDTPRERIERLARQSGVNPGIIISKFVTHQEIPKYLAAADFAINPVKPVPTKRYCTSIKDGEYWAMGLPVVITKNISDDSEIIEQNNIGAVINALNNSGYLEAVKKIDLIIKNYPAQELKQRIRKIAEIYRNYSIAEKIYENVYRQLQRSS